MHKIYFYQFIYYLKRDNISLSNIFKVTHVSILFKVLQRLYRRLTLVKEVDGFGWMMSGVEEVRHLLQSAPFQVLELIIVIMVKMLV